VNAFDRRAWCGVQSKKTRELSVNRSRVRDKVIEQEDEDLPGIRRCQQALHLLAISTEGPVLK
jgi:hypothetical protein